MERKGKEEGGIILKKRIYLQRTERSSRFHEELESESRYRMRPFFLVIFSR